MAASGLLGPRPLRRAPRRCERHAVACRAPRRVRGRLAGRQLGALRRAPERPPGAGARALCAGRLVAPPPGALLWAGQTWPTLSGRRPFCFRRCVRLQRGSEPCGPLERIACNRLVRIGFGRLVESLCPAHALAGGYALRTALVVVRNLAVPLPVTGWRRLRSLCASVGSRCRDPCGRRGWRGSPRWLFASGAALLRGVGLHRAGRTSSRGPARRRDGRAPQRGL
mmetsp:Transcript_95529/g.274047  ORF Transcript_95529/g.274047 Transcript_95529/m.274047 type:complete len:225 (+) Transcript_95529:474-1148(+)